MSLRVFIPRDSGAIAVGADEVAVALNRAAAARNLPVEIVRTGSRGLYWLEPMVEIETSEGRIAYGPVAAAYAEALLDAPDAHPLRLGRTEEIPFLKRQTRLTFARCGIVDPLSIADSRAHGGWRGLTQALKLGPAAIVEEVVKSGLRGRGGAGFPTGIKWRTAREAPSPEKYIVCNADEGDSGTFADRMLMEGDPFLLIEGMIIAGIAVGADKGFVYIRSEYPAAIGIMEEAVAEARKAGYLGASVGGSAHAFDIEIRAGAGAYVCGEETSLLDSLEGKRGQVRTKPPLPAHQGLFGKPTIINNVLTLAAVPTILAEGADFYRDFGLGRWRHGQRPTGTGGAGRRAARRLFPARPLRHALRLRSFRRQERVDRPWRRRGVRRHGRYGTPGALRARILRLRILREMHALPDRIGAGRRGRRQDPARPGAGGQYRPA